jgi:hypothetical protein
MTDKTTEQSGAGEPVSLTGQEHRILNKALLASSKVVAPSSPEQSGFVGVPVEPIPTRERCAACQQVSPIGFWVPNEMCATVVHPFFQNSILCLQCFISRADEKLIDWSAAIKLYPVSLAHHLREARQQELAMLATEKPALIDRLNYCADYLQNKTGEMQMPDEPRISELMREAARALRGSEEQ